MIPFQVKDLSLLEPHRPELPQSLPEAVSSLIQDCWAPDPKDRPDFRRISARIDALELDSIERYWNKAIMRRISKMPRSSPMTAESLAATSSRFLPGQGIINEILHKVISFSFQLLSF